jgi:hypothetical protein
MPTITRRGYSKRIRINSRSAADTFFAKDFAEMGGISNAWCYHSPSYMAPKVPGLYNSSIPVTFDQVSDIGTADVLVCTSSFNTVTPGSQTSSTQIQAYLGGSGVNNRLLYVRNPGSSFLADPSSGPRANFEASKATWWERSFMVMDHEYIAGTVFTAQSGFAGVLGGNEDYQVGQQQVNSGCEWTPGQFGNTFYLLNNLVNANGAILNSCTTEIAVPGSELP